MGSIVQPVLRYTENKEEKTCQFETARTKKSFSVIMVRSLLVFSAFVALAISDHGPHDHDHDSSSPATSYGAPAAQAPSYSAPSDPVPTYVAQAAPSPSYAAPADPAPSYAAPAPSYAPPSAPAPSYQATLAPSYAAPSSDYSATSDAYGAPSDSYGAPSDAYGAPSDAYGAPSDAYGAPSQTYSAPAYQAQYAENTGYATQKDSGFGLIKTILKFDIVVAGFFAFIASIIFGPILGTIFFDIIALFDSIF